MKRASYSRWWVDVETTAALHSASSCPSARSASRAKALHHLRVGLWAWRREHAQRRKAGLQVRALHLNDRQGLAQAVEAMRTQPAQAHAGWPGPAERIARGCREQYLAAVPRGADPRHRVNRQADVACVGQRRAAAVDAGPDLDADALGPGASAEVTLNLERRLQRARGTDEHGKVLVGARV